VKEGSYAGKSATQIEIERARERGKPIYFFIRDRAEIEFQQLRADKTYRAKWVEPKNDQSRQSWLEFVSFATNLSSEKVPSNWKDQFTTIVDLKKLVLKRLADFQNGLRRRNFDNAK
jgi:hypothetical protein